jgi:hypothetical protein
MVSSQISSEGEEMARTISSSVTGPVVLSAADNPLTITNTGTITATADDIDGASGTTWTVVNQGTLKSSSGSGISLAGAGSVSSTGVITGSIYGVELADGGLVTNTGSITGGKNAIKVFQAAGTISNLGVMLSTTGDAVSLDAGGSVTNAAGASIVSQGTQGAGMYIRGGTGATATNAGRITGIDYGVDLGTGGTVANSQGGFISGKHGVNVQSGTGVVNNSGTINATSSFGIRLNGGGQVTNATGGSISGQSGVLVYGSGGTVTNNGTISAATESVIFNSTGANRLVVGQSAVCTGDVLGSTATGSTNTLELQIGPGTLSNLVSGNGTLNENGHAWSFENFGTIAVDSGGAWTFSGSNSVATVIDNGAIDLAGPLTVTGSIDPSSKGVLQLNGNQLEVSAALGTSTQISFLGSGALKIDNVGSFGINVGTTSYAGPILENFQAGDTIDLKTFAGTGVALNYNASTGVLQISNSASQVASLMFQTSSLGSGTFHETADGASGILITHN